MFCISVNHGGVVWAFIYRTEETARAAHEKLFNLTIPATIPGEEYVKSLTMESARLLHNRPVEKIEIIGTGIVTITDDYGQVGTFRFEQINGVLFEDFDQSKGAHVERTIHATKVQLEAQKRMHSDPGIRASSPAVFAPGMNNGLIR